MAGYAESHAELMVRLWEFSSKPLESIAGSSVVYLEYPRYLNVGDLLIHVGAERGVARQGISVLGKYCLQDLGYMNHRSGEFVAGRRIGEVDSLVSKGATIVLQGGGNLGDLWPGAQQLREAIIDRYPHAKIVILPQSAEFAREDAFLRACRTMSRHKALKLYCRDVHTLDLFKPFLDASLAPDMAHQLWGDSRFVSPSIRPEPLLVQLRTDKESRVPSDRTNSFDWPELTTRAERTFVWASNAGKRITLPSRLHHLNESLWFAARDAWIGRATAKVASAQQFETDRLHGVILAALVGTPVRFRDNSYGKLGRYYSAWFAESPAVSPVTP